MNGVVAASLVALVLLAPTAAWAQDARAALESAARASGAAGLTSIQITGSGMSYAAGQAPAPGLPWPKFNVKSLTRDVNYDTATLRDDYVRTQAEDPPRGGGVQPIRGEARQILVVSGDLAWNVVADAPVPAPIGLAERQFQLWSTPHGVIKGAIAANATLQGRTIAFAVPGRFSLRATLNDQNLVERVEGVLPNPVVGDLPVEIAYSDYKDFGGVKYPTRIRQSAAGFPTLDLTVTDVRPNAPVDAPVPEPARQAAGFYAKVASQKVADGVWYVAGGSHHSVVIEMRDHVIVAEGPLNDERALAVIAETRRLVPGKPIRYVIASHNHFDHTGGLRAFAAEGITVITHEVHRAFFERTLAAPATIAPDHLSKSGKKGMVEGVRDRRVLTDGTRTVELRHIAGNGHDDGLLMTYLPAEKLLIEADVFTPLPPNAPPPTPVSPFSVNLADNLARQGLAVDQILPLHGRVVPVAELYRTIGRNP
jgi:glyoxylase-like metal-dependent hydrolase (beta-lactamase superfamily II)